MAVNQGQKHGGTVRIELTGMFTLRLRSSQDLIEGLF